MVGIVVVTHGSLGEALLDAVRIVMGELPDRLVAVSIDLTQNVDKLRSKLSSAIASVDENDGILVLTDMFGGTPSNLSYSFLEEGRIEVISGVNLPVLIKALTLRKRKKNLPLPAMAREIEECGKKSISMASGILKGNKRKAV